MLDLGVHQWNHDCSICVPPPCAIDGENAYTGASDSYLTATPRTPTIGGTDLTLSVWVKRTRVSVHDRVIDFSNGESADNFLVKLENTVMRVNNDDDESARVLAASRAAVGDGRSPSLSAAADGDASSELEPRADASVASSWVTTSDSGQELYIDKTQPAVSTLNRGTDLADRCHHRATILKFRARD